MHQSIKILAVSAQFAAALFLANIAGAEARVKEFLADDFYIEEKTPEYSYTRQADPMFVKFPWVLRKILDGRKDGPQFLLIENGLLVGAEMCAPSCYENESLSLLFGGKTLVSAKSTISAYFGGRAAAGGITSYLFDTKTKQRINFQDIFKSWSVVKPLLQAKFCQSSKERGERTSFQFSDCPSIDEMHLFLEDSIPHETVSVIKVESYICTLGPCIDGLDSAANEKIFVDEAIIAQVKSRYLSDFLGDKVEVLTSSKPASNTAPNTTALPNNMAPKHKAEISRYIGKNLHLRMALTSDYELWEEEKHWFGGMIDNPNPYYVAGDFNADGLTDFAAVLIDMNAPERKGTEAGFNCDLVIFEAQENGEFKLAFTEERLGIPYASILFSSNKGRNLGIGATESHIQLVERRSDGTYELTWGDGY